MVQSEPIGPDQAAVHNRYPEISSQCSSLNFGISTPVSPVHVPSHPNGIVINSQGS